MQEEFVENLRNLDLLIQELADHNSLWIRVNDELKRLESFFRDVTAQLESKAFNDKPVEEKQQILEVKFDRILRLISLNFFFRKFVWK